MIAAGSRLGPYEIAALLGAGGMGEVYRARDSRLGRTVAIKILPGDLSSDPRLRERFEREARAISALSHPHICTLYDIGSEDGVDFLVMEYLEGENLAERLERGPLPLEQVIRYGVEIAGALEKAHRAGIVHRDLKPGNVILTKGGAKLLDFGLAKYAPSARDPNPQSMTQHKPLTEQGMVVGTLQYMAPEQLVGSEADARTDIFALGALLYEMATGRRAFEGSSRASLIAAILEREPAPMSAVQPLAPAALQRIVSMCLMKDPDERWQSAHDVAAALRWLREASGESIARPARGSRRKSIALAGALALAGLLAGASIAWLARRDAQPRRPTSRFTMPTPSNARLRLGSGSMAISRDGTRIAYVGFDPKTPDKRRLYLRTTGNPNAVPIAGTEDAESPAFSPDGKWIAYVDHSALKKVSVAGGTPIRLAPVHLSAVGVEWAEGAIYYVPDPLQGVWSIGENGGTPRQVVKPDPARGYRAIFWPHLLPGGEALLATAWTGGAMDDAKIIACSLRDGTSRVIVSGGSAARYSPTGHLVYARGANLLAVPFDSQSLEAGATPVTAVAQVAFDPLTGGPQFALAANGDMIFVPGGEIALENALLWVDRNGKATPAVPTLRPYVYPATSGDGRTIAVGQATVTYDVWVVDSDRDILTRVSFGGDDVNPMMQPDGRYVYWSSARSGAYNLYRAPADGSGSEERLTSSPHNQYPAAISPDNRFVVFHQTEDGQGDVWILPLDTRKPRPLLTNKKYQESPFSVSPDGRWLGYRSNESGRHEMYVRSLEGDGGKWQITVGGGQGEFTSGGREIVYRQGSKIYSVPVETSPQFRAGKPRLLLQLEGPYHSFWDVTADGQRMLFIKEGPRPSSDRIEIVLNWAEELRRRVTPH